MYIVQIDFFKAKKCFQVTLVVCDLFHLQFWVTEFAESMWNRLISFYVHVGKVGQQVFCHIKISQVPQDDVQ